jgi:phosphonate transport system substrate-binding protein
MRLNAVRGLLALGLALALAGCGDTPPPAKAAPVVNFSILSIENSQAQAEDWQPLLDDMAKETGLTIKPVFASNYTALVEAMRFNQVQVGWFSNEPGLDATRRANGEVFARSTDPSGVDGYFSVIIANAGSKVTLESLLKCDKTLTFGMGDPKSTSGTLAPMTYLFGPRNVDPQTCFKTVRSANHQANMFGVASGVVDAATGNSTGLRILKEKNPKVGARIKVIWTSPRLPEDPIVWRKDLDPAVKEKIRSFFLTYGSEAGAEGERRRAILAKLSFGGFKPADNSHLLPVREMEATRELISARNAHDNAAAKKAEDKLRQIAVERAAAGDPVAASQ